MARVKLLSAVAAVLALGLFGCSPQEPEFSPEDQVAEDDRPEETPTEGEATAPDGGGGGGDLTFNAEDIAFVETEKSTAAGAVTLELVNDGNLPHDVTIEDLGDQTVVEANGGESATGEVELEPGTYTFYCSVANHRESGMEGTLTVE